MDGAGFIDFGACGETGVGDGIGLGPATDPRGRGVGGDIDPDRSGLQIGGTVFGDEIDIIGGAGSEAGGGRGGLGVCC